MSLLSNLHTTVNSKRNCADLNHAKCAHRSSKTSHFLNQIVQYLNYRVFD